ncbi:MAG: hypothetical protein IJS14_10670 [Lentisphaeria bacterium]|nr:hypothetical protein [Lentisphaeria bacterium]
MKTPIYGLLACVALTVVSGCTFTAKQREQYSLSWEQKMTNHEIAQMKAVLNDSIYSERERQDKISGMIASLPSNFEYRHSADWNVINQWLSEVKLRRKNSFDQLSQAVAALKPVGAISESDAEDCLEKGKKLRSQLDEFSDLKDYPNVSAKLDAYFRSLFQTQPKLVETADKAFSKFPSEANKNILAAAFSGKDSSLKKTYGEICQNLESVKIADAKFEIFLKNPDDAHWDAFKTQAEQIGYPEDSAVRRKYSDYIRKVDHCKRIQITLKYWELLDSGFFRRKTGDIGVRIWSGQSRPFFRQLVVENAECNWHSDLSFQSQGEQKTITYSLTASSDNDVIRMVCIHFQNSSGRTVESPVFQYTIYQLAALSYKTGSCEVKLETSPVNSSPGPRKGVMVFIFKDLPKMNFWKD